MLASNLNIANFYPDVNPSILHTHNIASQQPAVKADEVLDFLFNRPEHAGQFIEVVTGADHPSDPSFFRVEDFAVIVRDLLETYAKKNIWLGALPRVRQQKWPQHGRSEDVETLTILYADLDGKDADPQNPEAGKGYLKGRLQALARSEFGPTLLVDSGGGFHVYWALNEPVDLETWNNLEQLLYIGIFGDWTKGQKAYAAAHDRRRLLRLPGSVNRKPVYGPEGKPVIIERFHPHRINATAFRDGLKLTADRLPRPGVIVTGSRTADVLAYLKDGAQPGQRHAAVASIMGKLLAHGIQKEIATELARCWWDARVKARGWASPEDTEAFEVELNDLGSRYEKVTAKPVDLTSEEIAQILQDYPGLRLPNPRKALRVAIGDGIPAGHLITTLNHLGYDGDALVGRVLWHRDKGGRTA